MSNNKPDRKLNLAAETVRVLNPNPTTEHVLNPHPTTEHGDKHVENAQNSKTCPPPNPPKDTRDCS